MKTKLNRTTLSVDDTLPTIDLHNGLENIKLSVKDGQLLIEAMVADNGFNPDNFRKARVSITFPVSDLEVDGLSQTTVSAEHETFEDAVVISEANRLNIILDDIVYNFANAEGYITTRNSDRLIVSASLTASTIWLYLGT
ncbi:MAG TPA: hypothetical protein VMR45_03120 [Patescibacteria group bacterium]|nr:hypothetical protein [Patescibacteria group bacterium]